MKRIKLSKDQFIEGQVISAGTEIEIQENKEIKEGFDTETANQYAMNLSYGMDELLEIWEKTRFESLNIWFEKFGTSQVYEIQTEKIQSLIELFNRVQRF